MKYRHCLMFISRSLSASSSIIPCLLLPGVCSTPAVPREPHSTIAVMLSSELGEKGNRETTAGKEEDLENNTPAKTNAHQSSMKAGIKAINLCYTMGI